jgi:hypothetical protein
MSTASTTHRPKIRLGPWLIDRRPWNRRSRTCRERARALKDDLRSSLQLLARMHEGLPLGALGAPDEQALDGSAARHTPAEEPCRKDARVVDDEHVAPLETLGKRRDGFIDHRADCAIEEKHARGAPLW